MNKKIRNLKAKGYRFTGLSTDNYNLAKEIAKQERTKGVFATIVPHTCLGRIYNTIYYRIYIKGKNE